MKLSKFNHSWNSTWCFREQHCCCIFGRSLVHTSAWNPVFMATASPGKSENNKLNQAMIYFSESFPVHSFLIILPSQTAARATDFQNFHYHVEWQGRITTNHKKIQIIRLRYKPAERGIDSWWGLWDFLLTWSFRPHYDHEVDSAANKNEYCWVKTAGA
jgi:hypothetical protein